MPRLLRLVLALFIPTLLAGGLLAAAGTSASAHEERPTSFPDGSGKVPKFKGYDNPNSRVVCRPESRSRIKKMPAGARKQLNQRLIRRCDYGSIQDAINSIKKRGTSIYVLPGLYEERKYAGDERTYYCSHLGSASRTPLKSSEYIGSISSTEEPPAPDGLAARADETDPIGLSYADQVRCPHNLNLIALFGDQTPAQQVDPLRQPVLRHPDRGHRDQDDRRTGRQPVQEAQRDPPGPGRAAPTCRT